MPFLPHYWTTVVGSFPQLGAGDISSQLASLVDVPAWPQLPRRTFRESMYVQYSRALPGLVVDEGREKVYFNTETDLTPALEKFYESYLAEDVEAFGLTPAYAEGFFALLGRLGRQSTAEADPNSWVKGQVTGPISFGLTVTDQDLRASLYNELLVDAIIKNTAMSARWQVRQLKTARPNVIIFLDEPYLASFGSAFISLSREQVIAMLDEVFEAIHAEGALAGIHCCANTDWSVLLATQVDILNLDAYGYLENLALYPAELRAFLDRGGVLAWGIVPNNEEIFRADDVVGPEQLASRLRGGLRWISDKAAGRGVKIAPAEFNERSLILPSCGLGSATREISDRVLEVLVRTGEILREL